MLWTIIGFCAATLTMFAFIPQTLRVLKTKSVDDVSLVMLLQLFCGVSLWITYGIARRDIVLIVANTTTLVSIAILLFLYYKYRTNKR